MSLPAADRAREMWSRLAGSPAGFPGPGDAGVVVSPESSLCPPGWSGMVELDGAILAVVPRPDLVNGVRERLLALLGDGDGARAGAGLSRLAVGEVLGPAELAYLDETDFRPAGVEVERLPSGHGDVEALLASVPEADAVESGLERTESPVYVLRDGSRVVAASAYRTWVETAAHLCVLTADPHRGRGLARAVASAAVADALADGLLPQWRARPAASRRVAAALGFRRHGEQLSVRDLAAALV
ncbi:GNAT family N-acetyltransferase [Nonomuraea fuscirosea]|uniref:GNAT family N-acetyltransferase n=1 Tax=Nonomuraea fuscirosea TaxID=1291556 RepID=UPI002DDA74E3|nr:GNAT family N-acetyltransferase [Nonomuraea fuscirosea]WSA50324.1 GNAT family N-acetyltransferase [Nonomuraea fuscirosea]